MKEFENINSELYNDLVTYHRRGQWFKSSTAHHDTSPAENATYLTELLLIRGLLFQLLGSEGMRRLALKGKPNKDLFELYDSELILSLNNDKNLCDTRKLLSYFRESLGESPPSAEAAKVSPVDSG